MAFPRQLSITVFTPAFNRADTLQRVWVSLCAQTFRDFEWLIVDDGSTDGTKELVDGFAKEADFPVRYFWQAHQHKKMAHNLAVREARGQLFICFDSDDECVPKALERFWWHWQNIPPDEREKFSAVTALCQDVSGMIIGDSFPGGEWIDSTSVEMAHRFRVRGEKWGFHRTEVLRQFSFPEGVTGYVPESYVWLQIDQFYKTRYVNEALRLYHCEQSDSQIRGMKLDPRPGADGAVLSGAMELRESARFVLHNPVGIGKLAANLVRLMLHSTLATERCWRLVWSEQPPLSKLLVLAGAPAGLAVYLKDRWRLRQ